ncbi:MAG: alpha/beta hydrolase [Elusimicrobiota bacterium]
MDYPNRPIKYFSFAAIVIVLPIVALMGCFAWLFLKDDSAKQSVDTIPTSLDNKFSTFAEPPSDSDINGAANTAPAYSYPEQPDAPPFTEKGPFNANDLCGDKVCDSMEKANINLCPADCGFSTKPAIQFSVLKDLIYASDSSAQKLDLYLPRNTSGETSLIIEIHGGGFEAGDKNPSMYAEAFVQNGYAVAAINYRLSKEAKFPAANQDVKSAVRWLRANADKYHINGDKIGVIGGSAGGYFASFLGTTGDIRDFDVGNNLNYSSAVQAVVDQFGPVNFFTIGRNRAEIGSSEDVENSYLGCLATHPDCVKAMIKASPTNYVSKNDAPFFIIHGEKDDQIPIKQSDEFYSLLKNAGVPVKITRLPNAGHGGLEFNNYFNDYLAFFDSFLKDTRPHPLGKKVPGTF